MAQLIDGNRLFTFAGDRFLTLVAAGAAPPADFAAWAGIPSGASLEGFMFPDTYQLPPEISAEGLRELLLRSFRERVGDDLRREALEQGLTLHQVVTLASIVEREAVWRDEHALIASVYRNRLNIDMALEADPTVQYGIQGARGSWWPQITRARLSGCRFALQYLPPARIAAGPDREPRLVGYTGCRLSGGIRVSLLPRCLRQFTLSQLCADI